LSFPFLNDPELITEILLYVPYKDLSDACRTNKTFLNICRGDYFWRKKVEKDWVPILGTTKVEADLKEAEVAKLLYSQYQQEGIELLREAIEDQNMVEIKRLIANGVDINANLGLQKGISFLVTAKRTKTPEIIRLNLRSKMLSMMISWNYCRFL
jgi:hypothetical protein